MRVGPATRRSFILALAPPPARREELADFLRHRREHRRADVLVWSAGATRLLGDPSEAPDGVPERAVVALHRSTRVRAPVGETARATLARFRAEHARRYGDRGLRRLIHALLHESPAFRALRPRDEVLHAQLGTRRVDHPRLGRLDLHHLPSIPTSHPDLRLVRLVPADAATRGALA